MMEQFKKYKWYILIYILYVSIVFVILLENANKRDFWPGVIVYCITLPLALYLLWSLFLFIKKRKR